MAVADTNYARLTAELAMTDGSTKKVSLSPLEPAGSVVQGFKQAVMAVNADTDTSTRPTIIGTDSTNQLKTGHTYPNDCPISGATIENIVKTSIYTSNNASFYSVKESED